MIIACARHAWRHMPAEANAAEVAVAERYADGCATDAELEAAHTKLQEKVGFDGSLLDEASRAVCVSDKRTVVPAGEPVQSLAAALISSSNVAFIRAQLVSGYEAARSARTNERAAHIAVLRDLFGNLAFRRPAIEAAWVAQNEGAVTRIASGIYEERAFEQMPLLGDALEEVGCADEEVLEHCRKPGEHFRGCWLLDLILGKS